MINLNTNQEEITLVAISEKNLPKFVLADDTKTTFISGEHKIYMVLNEKTADRRKQLKKALTNFVATNKMNVNVDLASFLAIAKELEPKIVFNTIFETIDFHSFNSYSLKSKKEDNKVVYNLMTKENFTEIKAIQEIKAEMVNYTRMLQDTPPNIGTSVYFAKKIIEDAKKIPGVKATVLGIKEAKELGMGLFVGVNAGSSVEGQVVILEYTSDAQLPKTALVGKGITFDSGGYNLKPSQFMDGMKFDMSGAAIMLSTVMALAKAKAKANVVAIGMFTDNRIGGSATMPESVLTSMNGKTVQIDNTDAEGRLVLADGITYAIRQLNADRVIEASTLTGAITIALGHWFTGAFSTNDELYNEVEQAAKISGEGIWRLPLIEEHLEMMQATPIADLTNSEKGREAGSSTAAAFLNAFAEEKPYIHLDIAGTADQKGRGTAIMLKTLFEMLNK
ncbi:M17 family metallopeptidase [Williamsoniiplasma lucivorax]|uniref:Probable cytosol aminopeptidase n=1 Tax=Williamsoniiplasma lucivorax TaxID=209274 RepID=A0A2S5RFH5_9MOLU|nr:M17 family metallopeptidase [Williamsoniiplasma lucivorax]PPE06051.1 leucyl aminopeptidase [Williamsoniiplasma lucivorax]